MQRRPLLQALALSPLASAFTTSAQTRHQGSPAAGYGPLRPVADEATGLQLWLGR